MNSKTVKAIGVIIIVAQALALISTHMAMDDRTFQYLLQSAGMNMFTYVITTIAEILVKAVPFWHWEVFLNIRKQIQRKTAKQSQF